MIRLLHDMAQCNCYFLAVCSKNIPFGGISTTFCKKLASRQRIRKVPDSHYSINKDKPKLDTWCFPRFPLLFEFSYFNSLQT